MLLPALGILCGFALVALCASAAHRPAGLLACAAGAVIAAFLPQFLYEPASIALLAATGAGLALFGPRLHLLAAGCGGAAGWCWTIVLAAQGLPRAAGVAIALSVGIVTALCTRRMAGFAPMRLKEEALLLVLLVGIIVAAAPVVSSGYSTALQLRSMSLGSSSIAPSAGAFVLAGACAVGGALFALWRNR